ncbi:uncharacterized protein UMAG_11025 [Mycosarcoma maydis]|uniref:UDENN domain-containing protein n=1 Tax=Mycosarcoma maydis TaxID=5270 RepID=A0A0D1CGN2_MYCMD|nr:uncharacterized protein UMAG_11025 [Ustilago maydis 521]KIS66128.1 hypothetical protein UMAG_11025 [Ustilago maydis 521]|eukprot:XP_011392313.1 hypothetical protein UMAG_11025 [Ustilago maydis 521]
MVEAQAEAGPSSAPNLSLLPANVLTIFLARFHVRHGNQIDYQYPSPSKSDSSTQAKLIDIDDDDTLPKPDQDHVLDLTGVEWKVLPSGGHLIEKDVIYFQTSHKGSTGVACFRNVKLDDTSADSCAQRGARMVSVGLILQCEGRLDQYSSSLAQQLAIVPHLSNLETLADELVHNPEDLSPLRTYYEMHKARSDTISAPDIRTMDEKRMKQLRMRRRRDPRNLPHDPISHMPALCGSLGALLPHLLKKLMLPRHRLLIFSPSPPIVYAAQLGYNLADLVALGIARSGKRHENLQAFARRWIVQVKGQIGVHDISALEDEAKRRNENTETMLQPSWIAWSTDKILLEKPHLFDSVLDLTPLITSDSKGLLDEACLENATTMARLSTVVRPSAAAAAAAAGRGAAKAQLNSQSWTTREFATFNELDAQAQRHAERAERLGAGACVSRRKSKNKLGRSTSRRSEDQHLERNGDIEYTHEQTDAVSQWRGGCARSPRRSGAGTLSAVLAFLRYWLAGWWFLPSHWRYGLPAAYVLPLGIRGDGGVRASILVMPEDESDEDQDDLDQAEDREIAAEDEEEEERRSALSAEPDVPLATIDAGRSGDVQPRAMPVQDQHTSTNSSSDTEGLDLSHTHRHHHLHHLVPPDPLLAAVGASPVRGSGNHESDRLSMSHASLHRRRSTDRSLYARSSTGGDLLLDPSAWHFDQEQHTRLRSIISDSLWMVWSHWTTALISGLLDVLEDRLAQIEQEDVQGQEDSDGDESEISQLLVAKVQAGLQIELDAKDMASLGLSAGNKLDVELVETLGSQYLRLLTSTLCDDANGAQARVKVYKGWPMFRWLL